MDRNIEIMFIRSGHEKLNFTKTFTDILEEAGEPWPKKIKIDRSNLNLEEQQQLLQRLHYSVKKSSNRTLCFSQVLYNVNQKGLELQDGNTTSLITSITPYAHVKLCVDVNLQSRMVTNTLFYKKCILENRDCSLIGDICSELSQQNILITNPESWFLHTKEREKPIQSGRSWSELVTVNSVSNDIWAENFITRIEPLLKDAIVFQSSEHSASCHHVHINSRSKALYNVLKPATVCDRNSGISLPLSLQAKSFMKGSNSDLESLFYTNKNDVGNILSFPKQTRCPANNNFRRSKEFQHVYKPYSRKCKRIVNPKLVKCAAFELPLQDKEEHNCSAANEKNDTSIFSQRTTFNILLKEASKESSSPKCHIFSKATVEGDNAFSIDDNEQEKKARQHAFYDNQILQDNNIHTTSLWDTDLSITKREEDLTALLRHLNTLSSVPNMFEKFSMKHSSLKMMATMVTSTQKKKIKGFNENNVLFLTKYKTLHFVLRTNQKCIVKRFRNSISERKHIPRHLGTRSRAVEAKRKYKICEDVGGNWCSSVVAKTLLSFFETYKKIPLNDDCEELDQISFINKAIFNYENMEKYSKGRRATPSKITNNGHDAQAYILPKFLFSAITNCNCLLVQESKSKNSQYPNYISTNSQVLKQNNSTVFPINDPNSRDILSFTPVVFSGLCIAQNTTVSVGAWCSKVLFGSRKKQNSCIFNKMKSMLQDDPVRKTRVSVGLKHLKVKTVQSMKVLLHKGIFPSSTCGSELEVSMKLNSEYVREIENATVEKVCISKRNQHHSVILAHFKNESAKIIGSEDRLMEFSCGMTQEHSEDVTQKHLSPEFKNKYEFEMNQFDLVLKELNGFNDISNGNKNSLQPEQRKIIQEDSLELNCLDSIVQEDSKNIYENKENVTFSTYGTSLSYTTVVNQNENRQTVFKDTGLQCSGEQEVPHEDYSSRILDEELFYPTAEGNL